MYDMNYPDFDDYKTTEEEQFVVDSMSVVSDDELLEMQLGAFENLVSFIEYNGRKRKMEHLAPETKQIFIERLAQRHQIAEERRIQREMEIEKERKEELARKRKLQREERERKRQELMDRLQHLEEENERLKAELEKHSRKDDVSRNSPIRRWIQSFRSHKVIPEFLNRRAAYSAQE